MKTQGKRPQVLALLESQPEAKWKEIGLQVGLNRERVRQIAKEAGYTRRGLLAHPKCRGCGHEAAISVQKRKALHPYWCRTCRPDNHIRKVVQITCEKCGKVFHLWGNKRGSFLQNRRDRPTLRSLCSECQSPRNRVKVGYFPCGRCGTSVERTGQNLWTTRSHLRHNTQRNVYCAECLPGVHREQALYVNKVRQQKRLAQTVTM